MVRRPDMTDNGPYEGASDAVSPLLGSSFAASCTPVRPSERRWPAVGRFVTPATIVRLLIFAALTSRWGEGASDTPTGGRFIRFLRTAPRCIGWGWWRCGGPGPPPTHRRFWPQTDRASRRPSIPPVADGIAPVGTRSSHERNESGLVSRRTLAACRSPPIPPRGRRRPRWRSWRGSTGCCRR